MIYIYNIYIYIYTSARDSDQEARWSYIYIWPTEQRCFFRIPLSLDRIKHETIVPNSFSPKALVCRGLQNPNHEHAVFFYSGCASTWSLAGGGMLLVQGPRRSRKARRVQGKTLAGHVGSIPPRRPAHT